MVGFLETFDKRSQISSLLLKPEEKDAGIFLSVVFGAVYLNIKGDFISFPSLQEFLVFLSLFVSYSETSFLEY